MFDRSFVRPVAHLLLSIALFSAVPSWGTFASAADKNTGTKETKVAGILMQKKGDGITVKADGEEQPVKYVISATDKKVIEAMKHIFDAARVQLTYKETGDSRQLVSIKRQIFKENGTITGSVVKVYNDFWVAVKPKSGVSDAYAPGINYNDKAFMEMLKSLKPGDLVTIQYYTDFERHRIEKMTVNKRADAASTGDNSLPSKTPKKD